MLALLLPQKGPAALSCVNNNLKNEREKIKDTKKERHRLTKNVHLKSITTAMKLDMVHLYSFNRRAVYCECACHPTRAAAQMTIVRV